MGARNLSFVLAGVLVVGACGNPGIESSAGGKGGNGSGGNGGSSSKGGNGGSTSSGGTGGSFAPPPFGGTGGVVMGTGGMGPVEGMMTCSSSMAKAERLPVDIYILLDRSRSMTMSASNNNVSKWDSVKEAISGFVKSPDAAGISVGLGFFPLDSDTCTAAAYATPAVPIAALPGVSMPILDILAATMPNSNTPSLPALTGAVQLAQQWQATKNRRVAVLLATDGLPNGCNSSTPAVSAIAAGAAQMGINTFVLGVGPALMDLNMIAAAGNTKAAYQVENATADDLVKAFKSIQSDAAKLACNFAIPPPPKGEMLDPMKVNVRFTPTADPANPLDLGQVSGPAQCGSMGGWYFDNAMKPTLINLCAASCQKVNDIGGDLSALFGCKTHVIM